MPVMPAPYPTGVARPHDIAFPATMPASPQLSTDRDTADSRLRIVVLAGIVIAIAFTVGVSLIGLRSFHAADKLESFAPWRSVPPDNVVPTNPLVGDTVDAIMPEKAVMRDALHGADAFPTWNPLQLGGTAFSSIRNAGLFSVLNLPYWVLPLWYAPALVKLMELAVAIGFTAWFLRFHGLRISSGLIGGFIFAFSGFQVGWNNWHQTHVGALIAALFWSIEVVVAKRRVVWAIPLALVVATMWFEGFPSVTGYALFFGGIYAVVRALSIPGFREGLQRLVVLAGGVLLGTALAAFQLLPFAYALGVQDLGARAQGGLHLPFRTLATVVVPYAFGSPVDRNFYGWPNIVEMQSFLGIASVALIMIALVYGRRVVDAATFWYFVGALAFSAMLLWIGGPILRLLQETPLFGLNFIGRLRSVFGFLAAVVAAFGFEAVVRSLPARSGWRTHALFGVVLAGFTAVFGYVLFRAWQMARAAEELAYFRDRALIAGAVAIVVAAIIVAAHVRNRRARFGALVAIPLVLSFEIIAVAMPFWPQIPVDEFYPSTPAHEFLDEQLGDQRIASAGLAFYPSTTMQYGLRSVTGHAFHDPAWKDMLLAIDPEVMRRGSPTFSILEPSTATAGSPILDRMAAEFFAADPRIAITGDRQANGEPHTVATIEPGFERVIPTVGVTRGVTVTVDAGFDPGSVPDEFTLEVLDDDGRVIATGFRRLNVYIGGGSLQIPVPEVSGGSAIRLAYSGDDPIDVAVTSRGDVVLERVTATDDGLRLEHGGGAVIYRRLGALERIRWASQRIVEPDPERRLAVLASGVDPHTVVLSAGAPEGSGLEADIEVLRDEGDAVKVRVDADGSGFVVVADSIQRDWTAKLDGSEVEIIEADHALGAVAVPAGLHVVEFSHAPRGLTTGAIVSGVAVVLSLALLGTAMLRTGSADRPATTTGEPDDRT